MAEFDPGTLKALADRWNGATWIDVEVQDNRGDKPVSFTLPIVAEHQESNMWGYSSGDKAAQRSWERASVQLTRALDTIIRAVRDQQDDLAVTSPLANSSTR